MNINIVMTLAFITLAAALLYGVWSYVRAKRAKDHHEGSAAEGRDPMHSRESVPPEQGKAPPTPMPPRN